MSTAQFVGRYVLLPGLAFAAIAKGGHLQLAEWWRGKLAGNNEELYPERTVYDVANLCDTSNPDKFLGVAENIGLRTHRECFTAEESATLYEELYEKVVRPYGTPLPKGIRTGLWRALSTTKSGGLEDKREGRAGAVGSSGGDGGSNHEVSDIMRVLEGVRCVSDHALGGPGDKVAPWGFGDALQPGKMPIVLRSMVARVRAAQPNVGQVRHVVIHYFPEGAPLLLPHQIHTFYGFDYFIVPLMGRGTINRHRDVEARAEAIGFPTTAPVVHPDSKVNAPKKEELNAKGQPLTLREKKERKAIKGIELKDGSDTATANEEEQLQRTFLPKSVITFTPSRRSKTLDFTSVEESSWGNRDWDALLSLGDSLQVSNAARFSWQVSVRPSSWFGEKNGLVPGLRSFQFPQGVPFPPLTDESGVRHAAEGPWAGDKVGIGERLLSLITFKAIPPRPLQQQQQHREEAHTVWNETAKSLSEEHNIIPRDNLHDNGTMLVFICFEGAAKKQRGALQRPESIYFGEAPSAQEHILDDDGKHTYFGTDDNDMISWVKKAFAALDRSVSMTFMEHGKSVSWK